MTPEQADKKMNRILSDNGGDTEECHGLADDLLCEVLRSLGYDGLVDSFESLDKWYA